MAGNATWADVVASMLAGSAAKGRSRFRVAVMVGEQIELSSFEALDERSQSAAAEPSTAIEQAAARCANSLFQLVSVAQRPETVVMYSADIHFARGEFQLRKVERLFTVEPVSPSGGQVEGFASFAEDDSAVAIIDDVRASRQLVLSTAAMLIAEQDPRRLDNLLSMAAPFALAKIGGITKLARLGKITRILKQQISFKGLIKNRKLTELTHTELRHAFSQVGLREAHNAHFFKRLQARGPEFGIDSLDDFARQFNAGMPRVGKYEGTAQVVMPNNTSVIANMEGELITFVPL